MFKKVIYISLTFQNFRDVERFGYNVFKKNNFEIEHWNLGYIFYKKYYENYKPIDKCSLFIEKDFKSITDFYISIDKIKENVMIIDPWGLANYHKINTILNKSNIIICGFFLNNYMESSFRFNHKINYVKYLMRKQIKKIKNFKCLDFYMYAGKYSEHNQRFITDNKTKIIQVNSLDYYRYLKAKNCKKIIKHSYAVLLDEGVLNHPDYFLDNRNSKNYSIEVMQKKYIEDLNNFLNYFEKKNNLKIVISAHPRLKYNQEPRIYKNRIIYYDLSAELIKHSEFVIVHSSQAHTLAVLNFKKIIFLTSNILSKQIQNIILSRSRFLNSTLINLSKFKNSKIDFKFKITKLKYYKYIQNFIRSNYTISKKDLWDYFILNIKNEKN